MLKTLSILTAVAAAAGLTVAALPEASAKSQPVTATQSTDPVGEVIAQAQDEAPARTSAACEAAGYEQAAARNAATLQHLSWSPFGRAENGWAIYARHVAHDIGADCDPASTGFAAALSTWQRAHNMAGAGEATPQTLMAMKNAWQQARPYVSLRASGVCPDAPANADLTTLDADEGYLGKRIQLRPQVAQAYRAMVAAARAEVPEIAGDPQMLRIFSGYRSPEYDAARCARDGNCGGAARATCSVHRTAEAFDLVVGNAPGYSVDSSADPNRLYQSQTAAYRWLVANAGRFGFLNYTFEPWHWEFVGPAKLDAPLQQAAIP